MKILAIGDIHLGKNYPVIPKELAGSYSFWINTALMNAVDYAISEKVNVVVFTGDVIEKEDDRFEALPHLANSIKRLTDNYISVIAVSGNHDIKALPRISKLVKRLKILGNDQEWESILLDAENGESVNFIGLSHFEQKNSNKKRTVNEELNLQSEQVPECKDISIKGQKSSYNPFKFFNDNLCKKDVLNLGMLHCTVGSAPDKYFPVNKDDLCSKNVDLWLLGHIHKPDLKSKESRHGYLGSLAGLDITETGPHGAWLIETELNTVKQITLIPFAPLRWEKITVDLSDNEAGTVEDFRDNLIQSVQEKIELKIKAITEEIKYAKLLGFRVVLTGSISPLLDKSLIFSEFNNFYLNKIAGKAVFIEKLIDKTFPAIDFEKYSKQNDPPGLACKLILDLQKEGKTEQEILCEFSDFLKEHTTMRQRRFINGKFCENDLLELVVEGCKSNIRELWLQNEQK